ncbi:MAG: T9SS type A sorting domain-containing protein [Ferruginibacter sp.]
MDDGSETSATWLTGAPTITNINQNIRLRLQFYFPDIDGVDLSGAYLGYQTVHFPGFDSVTTFGEGKDFILAGSSPFVFDQQPTTMQLINGIGTSGAGIPIPGPEFQPGQIITATNSLGAFVLTGLTEFEWVIKPTTNLLPGTTYHFNLTPGQTDPDLPGIVINTADILQGGCSLSAPVASVTTQPNCTTANGTITVSSPTEGLAFSIDGIVYDNTTGVFNNVPPGTYNVTSKNTAACVSPAATLTINASPVAPDAPVIQVTNNCDNTSTLTVVSTGTVLWNTGATELSVNVTTPGTYTVTQTVNGCTSAPGSAIAAPKTAPAAPVITVTNNCNGTASLTAAASGTLLWSTQETSATITVTNAGTYSVTQTANGCTGLPATVSIVPVTAPSAPSVSVVNNCNGTSTLSTDATGALLWSTLETAAIITVPTAGAYTLTQTTDGCTSELTSVLAAPKTTPAAPVIAVVNNCNGTSILSTNAAGTLLWNTQQTTASITVNTAGTYSVTQTVNGCASLQGNAVAAPGTTPAAPAAIGGNNVVCAGSTTLLTDATAGGLWSSSNLSVATVNNTTGAVTGVTTGTTTITYTITNAAGCSNGSTTNFTVNALPLVYSVTGGGIYYTGGTGVPVGLSGSQTGISYQLKLNGSNSGAAITGAGAAISFGNKTLAGTYTVAASNAATTCSVPMAGSAVITISTNKVPLVNVSPLSQTVCTGSAFTILISDANNTSGTSFSWIRNNMVALTGVASSGTGSSISGTFINAGTTAQTATFTVTATSPLGSSVKSVTVTVNPKPSISSQPLAQTKNIKDNTSFSVTAAGLVTGYQWQLSTNTGSTWTAVVNGGVYSCATTATLNLKGVTNAMNCYQFRCIVTGQCNPAATSNAAKLTIKNATSLLARSGIESEAAITAQTATTGQGMQVFPNPTNGIFNLVIRNFSAGKAVIKITDPSGRPVQIKEVQLSGIKQQVSVNITNAAQGAYFIQVLQTGHSETMKIIKE